MTMSDLQQFMVDADALPVIAILGAILITWVALAVGAVND
jgi:hypothetical protein